MSRRGRAWLGPLVAAASAALYASLLLGPGTPYDLDRASFFLPYNRIYRDALAQGSLPLWSPAIWGGYPVHAEGQGGYCSPLRLVGLLGSDEVAGLDLELAALLVLAALAGAGGARLLFRPGPAGEALAGVVWSLGGGMLAVQENPAMQGSFLLLPLALGLAYRGRFLSLALALAFGVLSGYPYGPVLVALAAAPLACWKRESRLERMRGLALAFGLAGLLSAIQWLPTFELLQRSDRWGGLSSEQLTLAGVSLGDLRWLVSPLYPAAVRHSSDSGLLAYLGLLALATAGWGVWRGRRQGLVLFLAGAAGAALVLALLLSSPLGALVARIPGVGMVRGPNKLFFLVGAATALLAARGLRGVSHPAAAWLLVALVALDLGSYGLRRAVIVDRQALRARPRLAELCAGGRVYVGQVPLVWGRELPADATAAQDFLVAASPLDANHGVRWGVAHLAGYGPLAPARAVKAWSAPSLALLRRSGASHYVTGPRATPPSGDLPTLESTPRWTLCRVEGSLPTARAVSAVSLAGSLDEALALLPQAEAGRAVLEAELEAESPLLTQAPGEAGSVEIRAWEPGRVELDLNLTRPGLVLITDAWFPGWVARLDGRKVPLHVGDGLWKAVAAPAGRGKLELVYEPWSVRWGGLLSLLGLGSLVGLAIRRRGAVPATQSVDEGSGDGLGSPPHPVVEPPKGADHGPHP